jgi:hypothetical protein
MGRTLVGPISSVVKWTASHLADIEAAQSRYDRARAAR